MHFESICVPTPIPKPESDENGKLRFLFKNRDGVAGVAGDAGAAGAAGAAGTAGAADAADAAVAC